MRDSIEPAGSTAPVAAGADSQPADPAPLDMAGQAQQLTRAALRGIHGARLRRYAGNRGRSGLYPERVTGDNIDIDLIAAGYLAFSREAYLQPEKGDPPLFVVVTAEGLHWLAELTNASRLARQPHESLIAAVTAHLMARDRFVYTDIEFLDRLDGRQPESATGKEQCRPDVYSFRASLDPKSFDSTVHEVKVSRADLLADLRRPEKRLAYQRIAERVYYVVPEGLATKGDIPEGFGLILATPDFQLKTVVRARRNKPTLRHRDYLNLILKPPTARPKTPGAL